MFLGWIREPIQLMDINKGCIHARVPGEPFAHFVQWHSSRDCFADCRMPERVSALVALYAGQIEIMLYKSSESLEREPLAG